MEIPGYVIQSAVGQGGMATAYLAVQESLGRQVILKVLNTAANASKVTVERFLNEGRIVASLRHPNIITIYDVGTAGDQAYISMEYIDGGDLKSRLQRSEFSSFEALTVIEHVAAGLAVAHHSGVIHRDVKPGNILFRTDGTPILTDFGIAKQLTVDTNLTSTGMFVGSPNYMAPEQADSGPIDGRVDIYSLGVILFEMLTGQKPYKADSIVDVIVQHKKAPIPLLPENLAHFQELISLMLAKRRNDRFRDIDSLLHYMRQLPRIQPSVDATSLSEAETIEAYADGAAKPRVTRLTFDNPAGKYRRPVLIGVLIVVAIIYAGLQVAIDRLNAPAKPSASVLVTDLDSAAPPPLPTTAGRIEPGSGEQPDVAQVMNALTWLARHSLDEYRLLSPANDNAYYYYSRIQQLDADSDVARNGFKEIAQRYSHLAEQALAAGDHQSAQEYVAVGLRIDPANQTLQTLQTMAKSRTAGILDAILGLFK